MMRNIWCLLMLIFILTYTFLQAGTYSAGYLWNPVEFFLLLLAIIFASLSTFKSQDIYKSFKIGIIGYTENSDSTIQNEMVLKAISFYSLGFGILFFLIIFWTISSDWESHQSDTLRKTISFTVKQSLMPLIHGFTIWIFIRLLIFRITKPRD